MQSSDKQLQNTVLVTGGAVRLGAAITRGFASHGYDVAVHYSHSAEAAEDLCSQLSDAGCNCQAFCADLSVLSEVNGLMQQVVARMGSVNVLVNNAAIFPDEDGLATLDGESWARVLDLNLRAPAFLSKAFASQLQSEVGHIINMLDARVNRPGSDHLIYRTSKAGLLDLTRNLAVELAPRIRVNGVSPGAILSPPGQSQKWLQENKHGKIPLAQIGSTRMIADAVLYLAQQSFVTGQVLTLDGGEFL